MFQKAAAPAALVALFSLTEACSQAPNELVYRIPGMERARVERDLV